MTEKEFRTAIERLADEYEYVGLRGQDIEMREGEEFDHDSSRWTGDEYDDNDETYDGVCAIDLGARSWGIDEDAYRFALGAFRLFGHKLPNNYYLFDHLAVIVGDDAEVGQDEGEIVISDATVALVLC